MIDQLVMVNDFTNVQGFAVDQTFMKDMCKNNRVAYDSYFNDNGYLVEITTMLNPYDGKFLTMIEGEGWDRVSYCKTYNEALRQHENAIIIFAEGLKTGGLLESISSN